MDEAVKTYVCRRKFNSWQAKRDSLAEVVDAGQHGPAGAGWTDYTEFIEALEKAGWIYSG